MYPEDIARVFPAVPVGDTVTVVNESVKAAWIDGQLYVEAHPPLDQAMMIEEEGGHPYYDLTDADMDQILKVAGDKSSLIDWAKVRSVIRNREGYPIAVTGDDDAAQASDTPADAAEQTPTPVAAATAPGDDTAARNAFVQSMNNHIPPPKRKAVRLIEKDTDQAAGPVDADVDAKGRCIAQ